MKFRYYACQQIFILKTFYLQSSKAQECQLQAAAKEREVELLQHSSSQLKGQLQQLQELLATREQEHK